MEASSQLRVEDQAGALAIEIGPPVTVTQVADDDPADWQRIHPELKRLPGGRLVLTVSRDRDVPDAELLVFVSDDDGQSWQPTTNWPTADQRGEHVNTLVLALPDGETVVVNAVGLFATGEAGTFLLPTWRSGDDGRTWSEMAGAPVTLEARGTEPFNAYDKPQWLLDLFNGKTHYKPQMPSSVQRMAAAFGPKRLGFVITSSHVEPDGRLLLFAYLSHLAPGARGKHETVVLESRDRGESWQHIATPGAWEDRLSSEYFLTHRTDGLCEPAVTQLGDELLCVMRLGSRHPLYQTRSSDGGHTWSPPVGMPVYGILPALATLADGTVLLASGRPDVTLSVSVDGGHRWPWTYRFLEDGKATDASTRNNTMVPIGPQTVLYMYDYGGYHKLPEGFEGERRVVSHVVTVKRG